MIVEIGPRVSEQDRSRLFRLASMLLEYPDDELLAATPRLASAAASLDDAGLRGRITLFLVWFGASDPVDVQRHYERLFSLGSPGLNLTADDPDREQRGQALVALEQGYRAHGWEHDDRDLPDYLPFLLDFAAVLGSGAGEAPLRRHRGGVAELRRRLEAEKSPYAHVLAAVDSLLPGGLPIEEPERQNGDRVTR